MTFDTLKCAATLENLNQVIEFVEEAADRFQLATKKKLGMLIAVEEAFVNVCHYAYPDAEGDASISCGNDNGAFVVEIADSGAPFDVLSLPAPDTTSDIMDRQIGGLGVHFIRTLTDQVSYRREEGNNILQMILHKAEDTPP
ncbi:Anti-sigma regulatory factor (Ser/Thr protein kinase) [Trichlorobacter thiogenes]|uniref:Anti-sigma regulatory factor (Ser/Thr protein kinase) n=1 Tax=Trichlorobacter thiogenes TaxID=115783 RepID=A0A1T4Q569_9BACT|nr:ATP-binding protein [Trichlorobacter thiogenes]SJZ98368.1 Anti-sigma regulatory factor (Ser/Thr protein kinase) [Trichlorobacter thiogenes]